MPAIVLTEDDGTGKEVVVQMTPEDLALAGDTDAKRVARVWAERLTDTIKVTAFAEPPKFSKGTDFGDALLAMYVGARDEKGFIRSTALNESFEALPPLQRLSLETLPSQSPQAVPDSPYFPTSMVPPQHPGHERTYSGNALVDVYLNEQTDNANEVTKTLRLLNDQGRSRDGLSLLRSRNAAIQIRMEIVEGDSRLSLKQKALILAALRQELTGIKLGIDLIEGK